MSSLENAVANHYRRDDLLRTILDGLVAAGADPAAPDIETLSKVDEFHTAGRIMTRKALGMTPLREGMHVVDAGCGIGGTARALVEDYGCRATGIDLTPAFVEVAEKLTALMGLDDRCSFHVGSVTEQPFSDGSFDAAVTFHVAMNVADRAAFYGEVARVVKPGAPFCIFDVMKGPGDGMRYPVPWAETETTSFLRTPAETRSALDEAGFEITEEESQRDFAIDFFREVFANAAKADGPPPLGLHLLTGPNTAEKFSNYAAALEDRQIDPVIMVCRRR